MYKTILKYIGQLRTAEQRLLVTVLLAGLIIIFSLWLSDIKSSKSDYKLEITALKQENEAIRNADKRKIDSLTDANFKVRLDRMSDLEKYNHQLDSLYDQLRKIK